MPYVLEKDSGACGAGKPWSVKKQAKPGGPGGAVVPGGCHASRGEALKHMRALYANVPDSQAEEKELLAAEIAKHERAEQREGLRAAATAAIGDSHARVEAVAKVRRAEAVAVTADEKDKLRTAREHIRKGRHGKAIGILNTMLGEKEPDPDDPNEPYENSIGLP